MRIAAASFGLLLFACGGAGAAGQPRQTGAAEDGDGSLVQLAPTCPAPTDLGVHLVGRHDGCDPAGVRFGWSGSGFVARFAGTGVRVRLDDEPNEYTVVMDGAVSEKLVTTGGEDTHALALGLADGDHTLEFYRRTEASFGPSVLRALEVEGGALLEPPPPPQRRLELIGDSITCGYGNEGDSPTCPFSAATENHYLTYGALLARGFSAELSTVAWSGKGVVLNYGGDPLAPLPTLYDQAVDAQSGWAFAAWQPQAVLVNLGTNDYSTGTGPTEAAFVGRYTDFLAHLRDVYPGAQLFCTVGPMLSGAALTQARMGIAAAVAARNAAGDAAVRAVELGTHNAEPGCDYHPNVATHAAMAAELAPTLAGVLGW